MKPLIWVGSSRKDFGEFPDPVKAGMGYALYVAQRGGKHADAKPLRGHGGAGVVEIVRGHRGDAFRTVYTVRLADAVYVLHAFQGDFRQFSVERLLRFLVALGQDVEIVVKAPRSADLPPSLHVS